MSNDVILCVLYICDTRCSASHKLKDMGSHCRHTCLTGLDQALAPAHLCRYVLTVSLQAIMALLKSLASLCFLVAAAIAVPAQEKRVHHQAQLSDHVHDDAHGYEYDHEAFLGKEESKTFDQLTPEESKDRLA